jgi:hypothetical protein
VFSDLTNGTAGSTTGTVDSAGPVIRFTFAEAAVPEPLSAAVFGGLLAVGGLAVRRRRAAG